MEKTTEEKINLIEKEILRLIGYKEYLLKQLKEEELHKKEDIFKVSKRVVLEHFEGITEETCYQVHVKYLYQESEEYFIIC